jgi:hypothetical protein
MAVLRVATGEALAGLLGWPDEMAFGEGGEVD